MFKIIKVLLLSTLIILQFNSKIYSQKKQKAELFQRQVDAIKELQKKAIYPKKFQYWLKDAKYLKSFNIDKKSDWYLKKKKESDSAIKSLKSSLNVKEYFNILTNISMEKGWNIDYIYKGDGSGSYPILFTFKGNKFNDWDKIYKKYNKESSSLHSEKYIDYLNHIRCDGTSDGFFQYVALSIIGSQFALGWHANYHDDRIICTKKTLNKILKLKDEKWYKFNDEQIACAKKIKILPVITFNENKVKVRVVIFTKWGGFIERIYHIKKSNPYKFIKIENNVLCKYDCGIMF